MSPRHEHALNDTSTMPTLHSPCATSFRVYTAVSVSLAYLLLFSCTSTYREIFCTASSSNLEFVICNLFSVGLIRTFANLLVNLHPNCTCSCPLTSTLRPGPYPSSFQQKKNSAAAKTVHLQPVRAGSEVDKELLAPPWPCRTQSRWNPSTTCLKHLVFWWTFEWILRGLWDAHRCFTSSHQDQWWLSCACALHFLAPKCFIRMSQSSSTTILVLISFHTHSAFSSPSPSFPRSPLHEYTLNASRPSQLYIPNNTSAVSVLLAPVLPSTFNLWAPLVSLHLFLVNSLWN